MKLSRRIGLAATLASLVLSGCAHRPAAQLAPEPAVRAVLAAQQAAWNRQDLAGFMAGYARGDDTRFASGGDVTRGWQTVFDRYARRYQTAEDMGKLAFTEVEVTVLAPDSVLVFGHWQLNRAADRPKGLFTLVFRRFPDGWRIVHDHTSSATP